MIFHVQHLTHYTYSQPVVLEPHVVRLRPRCDAGQRLLHYELTVSPKPGGVAHCVDLDGDSTAHMWFGGQTDTLSLRVSFSVETLRKDPYDFIVTDPGALRLPMRLEGGLSNALAHYRKRARTSRDVDRFARDVAVQAGEESIPFLSTLNATIHERTRKTIRELGQPHPPEQTLAERSGSCRDLAVLFMDACRAVGIPARFVSGYWHAASEREKKHMHAWAEVYLPGGGWRGFDPSKGLAVADEHVAVAAGADAADAAPVTGSFRGTGATATMVTDLSIHYE